MKQTICLFFAAFTLAAGLSAATPALADAEGLAEPVRMVKPDLPKHLLQADTAGEVTVSFRLDADGRPRDIRAEASTHGEATRPVLRAVRQWRFDVDAGQAAQLSSARFVLPVQFNPQA